MKAYITYNSIELILFLLLLGESLEMVFVQSVVVLSLIGHLLILGYCYASNVLVLIGILEYMFQRCAKYEKLSTTMFGLWLRLMNTFVLLHLFAV